MINLSNQVAVITGGSRGIGASTAEMFSRAGANVALIYRNDADSAAKVIQKIEKLGRIGIAIKGGIENYGDCKQVVKIIMKKFNRIDTLVNNAGIWEYGEIDKMTEKNWNKTIDINLKGVFNMCNIVVPIMKRQKYGRIINISSTAGQRGEPHHSHYAASKGGIISFTKSLGSELIKNGIWVNCVAPGWVDTDMVRTEMKNPRSKQDILQTIPRGKIGKPQEIAGPIVFLASSLADHIVGEILNVNGGSVFCG
jgi:3-oxoacyl-[acyl-carrier protein] reductase